MDLMWKSRMQRKKVLVGYIILYPTLVLLLSTFDMVLGLFSVYILGFGGFGLLAYVEGKLLKLYFKDKKRYESIMGEFKNAETNKE